LHCFRAIPKRPHARSSRISPEASEASEAYHVAETRAGEQLTCQVSSGSSCLESRAAARVFKRKRLQPEGEHFRSTRRYRIFRRFPKLRQLPRLTTKALKRYVPNLRVHNPIVWSQVPSKCIGDVFKCICGLCCIDFACGNGQNHLQALILEVLMIIMFVSYLGVVGAPKTPPSS